MKPENKVVFSSLFISLIAEIFLIYIIYFNDYKISPVMPASIQVTINGVFNFCSALCLLIAIYFIKIKKIRMHRNFIFAAMIFSALFLINYILGYR